MPGGIPAQLVGKEQAPELGVVADPDPGTGQPGEQSRRQRALEQENCVVLAVAQLKGVGEKAAGWATTTVVLVKAGGVEAEKLVDIGTVLQHRTALRTDENINAGLWVGPAQVTQEG